MNTLVSHSRHVLIQTGQVHEVTPGVRFTILSVTPDDEALEALVAFQPTEGGRHQFMGLTAFRQQYPDARLVT